MRISSFFCFSKPAVSGDDASPASTTSRRSTRGQPIGDIPVPRTEPAAALNVTESAAPQRPSERPRRTGALTRLKQIRDSLRDSAFQHGVGVSQSTVSPAFNPFNTRTSSAQPKLGSFVYQDGAAAPVVPKSLRDAPGTAERAQPGKGARAQCIAAGCGDPPDHRQTFPGKRRGTQGAGVERDGVQGRAGPVHGGSHRAHQGAGLAHGRRHRTGATCAGSLAPGPARCRHRLATQPAGGEQGEALRMAWKFAAGIEGLKGARASTFSPRPRAVPTESRGPRSARRNRGLARLSACGV